MSRDSIVVDGIDFVVIGCVVLVQGVSSEKIVDGSLFLMWRGQCCLAPAKLHSTEELITQ